MHDFKEILGETGVLTDSDCLDSYNSDWLGQYVGKSKIVLRPNTTQQISKVLEYCNDNNLVSLTTNT